MSSPADDAAARRRQGRRTDLFLVLALMCLSAPFLRSWTAQPASRYLFAVAVVDDHSIYLDPYTELLGVDRAEYQGHTISDKAPFQPLLSTPAYALYRLGGADPMPQNQLVRMHERNDIGLWMVTMWSCGVPAAILIVLLRRYVARTHPDVAIAASASLVFGTVLLPFASLLFGHMLAATSGFAAWYLLRRARPSALALVGSGLLLGFGVGVEYTQVIVAGVLGIYAMVRVRQRAAWVVLGGFVGTLPLLIYNTLVWGGPTKTAYQGHLPYWSGSGALGVYNLVAPDPTQFSLSLFGARGLFTLTPIMAMAVAGCVVVIRNRTSPARPDAIVALVLLGLFLLATTGIDGYGGGSPGPRYLVPILPFFVLPLAEVWRRWRALCMTTACFSAFWMALATIAGPIYSNNEFAPADWLYELVNGDVDRSIIGIHTTPLAVLVVVPAAIALTWYATVTARRRGVPSPPAQRTESLEPA